MFGLRTYSPNSAKHPDAEHDDDGDDTDDYPDTLHAIGPLFARSGTAGRTTILVARLAWPKDVLATGQHLFRIPPSSPAANYTLDAQTTLADASCPSQSLISSLTSPLTRLLVLRLPHRALSLFLSTSTFVGFLLASYLTAKKVCAMQGMAMTSLSV